MKVGAIGCHPMAPIAERGRFIPTRGVKHPEVYYVVAVEQVPPAGSAFWGRLHPSLAGSLARPLILARSPRFGFTLS
eukprot:6479531-Amphidinium_carterae.1